mmetsp:Transcript_28231/g.32891  ORF Transcript_28231/g.32891 Transcript_28231/m.32891 type:complete len:473 (-) Transcript_28231:27-1445(-)
MASVPLTIAPMPTTATTTTTATATRRRLATSTLIDCIAIDDDIFNAALQDKGGSTKKKYVLKFGDNPGYEHIYNAASMIHDKLMTKEGRDRFPRLPSKNKSQICHDIGKLIYRNRNFEYNKFVLSQSNLHFQLDARWENENELIGFTISDLARLFAIIAHEDFESERSVILGLKPKAASTVGNRIESKIWVRLKQSFHDASFKVNLPSNWINAAGIKDFSLLKLNDPSRLDHHINRGSDYFKKRFKETLSKYQKFCKNYRSDTGNGSGKPENFMDWDEKEDVQFQYYTSTESPALFTFIFMLDRDCSYIFEVEHDGLGENAAISGDGNSQNPRRTPNRSLPSMIDNLMNVSKQLSSLASAINNSTATIDTPPVLQLSEKQVEHFTLTDFSSFIETLGKTNDMIIRGEMIAQNLSNLPTDTFTGENEKQEAKKKLKRQMTMNEGLRKLQNKMFKRMGVDLEDDDNYENESDIE